MGKVVVIVNSPEFTAENYDQVWEDLRAAGFSQPKGLLSHVGFARPEGGWMVVDVWESADDFKEFSKTLIPIIQKAGVKSMNRELFLRIMCMNMKLCMHSLKKCQMRSEKDFAFFYSY